MPSWVRLRNDVVILFVGKLGFPPSWRGFAMALGAMALAALVVCRVVLPAFWPQVMAIGTGVFNRSYGPDWLCGYTVVGATVCLKGAHPDP